MVAISGVLHEEVRYEFVPESAEHSTVLSGEIHLSPPVELTGVEAGGFIEIVEVDYAASVIEIQLTSDGGTRESIELTYEGDTSYIPLLSAPAFYAVSQARSGDAESAQRIIERTYEGSRYEWDFRNDCRDTLAFEAFVEVLDALSGSSGGFSHVQFRSGIGYFAKRILDDIPSGIYSFETLRNRVQRWNESENLEPLDLPEVLGEKLGRDYFRDGLSNERDQLIEIGFDPISFDPEWSTLVPACWIAHLVLTEGIDTAVEFVDSRPTSLEENYEDLKSAAFDADFGERGPEWGNVVALSLNSDEEDFRFDSFNYLKWTGEEYRGNAKLEPLLFAGAREISPSELPPFLLQQVEYKEQTAIGHAWRRDSAFESEEEAFINARDIARGETDPRYELNPKYLLETESSLAHAQAKLLGIDGNRDNQVARYEEAISEIQRLGEGYDVERWRVERELEFLEEMKRGL